MTLAAGREVQGEGNEEGRGEGEGGTDGRRGGVKRGGEEQSDAYRRERRGGGSLVCLGCLIWECAPLQKQPHTVDTSRFAGGEERSHPVASAGLHHRAHLPGWEGGFARKEEMGGRARGGSKKRREEVANRNGGRRGEKGKKRTDVKAGVDSPIRRRRWTDRPAPPA